MMEMTGKYVLIQRETYLSSIAKVMGVGPLVPLVSVGDTVITRHWSIRTVVLAQLPGDDGDGGETAKLRFADCDPCTQIITTDDVVAVIDQVK